MTTSPHDRRGVIRDAFNIENISAPECRTIFLDWALEPHPDMQKAAAALAAHYADQPNHPMLAILKDAATATNASPRRKGGKRR